MLTNAQCSLETCNNELKTFDEVKTGMCNACRNLVESRRYYAGVCWNCCRITGIYEIPRRLEGILTEKYLFSKGCSQCSSDPDADIDWITVKKDTSTSWAIDKYGKFLGAHSKKDILSKKE